MRRAREALEAARFVDTADAACELLRRGARAVEPVGCCRWTRADLEAFAANHDFNVPPAHLDLLVQVLAVACRREA